MSASVLACVRVSKRGMFGGGRHSPTFMQKKILQSKQYWIAIIFTFHKHKKCIFLGFQTSWNANYSSSENDSGAYEKLLRKKYSWPLYFCWLTAGTALYCYPQAINVFPPNTMVFSRFHWPDLYPIPPFGSLPHHQHSSIPLPPPVCDRSGPMLD